MRYYAGLCVIMIIMINSATLFFVARDQAGHGPSEEHRHYITHGARHRKTTAPRTARAL